MRQKRELAGAVIHDPHIHARRRLSRQNLQHPAPHDSLADDKIFHENKMLRRLQLLKHLFKLFLAQREISDRRLIIHRMTAAPPHIMRQRRRSAVLLCQTLHHTLILPDARSRIRDHLIGPLLQNPVPQIALRIQEQQHTEHRQNQDHDQPCDLGRGIDPVVQQIDHDHRSQHHRTAENMGNHRLKPLKNTEQDQNLCHKHQ